MKFATPPPTLGAGTGAGATNRTALALALALAAGCDPKPDVTTDARGRPVLNLGPQQPPVPLTRASNGALYAVLGGRRIAPETLAEGREAYVSYCAHCHGDRGDGRGPAAVASHPPPRDFTTGRFKFAAVPSGALPNDEDLARVVRRGLTGTTMLPWQIPEGSLRAIVQYLKTLSPRWRTGRPPPPVRPDTPARQDPWGPARRAEAVARGRAVYHGLAQCATCHPAYETRAEIARDTLDLLRAPVTSFRPDLYAPVVQGSEYGVRLLPPDFTRDPLRAGATLPDLYRTLSCGVGGTPMPGWRASLPERDIWAMVHYVNSLAMMRDTPEAAALRARLRNQPPWSPPGTPPGMPPADAGVGAP